MTLESEYQFVISVVATVGRRSTQTDIYKCRKCDCLVAKQDRAGHRDKMHPRGELRSD